MPPARGPAEGASMSTGADAGRRGGRVAVAVAGVAVGVAGLVLFWPGDVLALVPSVRAALGHGTPGVVRVTEVHRGEGSVVVGDFRSDDGRVVLRDRTLDVDSRDHRVGDSLRARHVATPGRLPGSRPADVYPASGSRAWIRPAVVTAAWLALLAWAARRLHRRIRRRA